MYLCRYLQAQNNSNKVYSYKNNCRKGAYQQSNTLNDIFYMVSPCTLGVQVSK